MKILDDYLKLEKEVHKYFGYKEDWIPIPIDDSRKYWWSLTGEGNGGIVNFARKKKDVFFGEERFESYIYTQRFLPKWVYRGKDYTMIVVDTHTDGNKFLQIFDNKKEIKNVSE